MIKCFYEIVYIGLISIVIVQFSCKKMSDSLETEDPDKVYEFFAVDEKPVIIHKEEPVYPAEAVKDSIEGIVVITILIKPDGTTGVQEVFKSVHALLDSAAINAALLCRFTPARHHGHTVYCLMNIPFHFKLDD